MIHSFSGKADGALWQTFDGLFSAIACETSLRADALRAKKAGDTAFSEQSARAAAWFAEEGRRRRTSAWGALSPSILVGVRQVEPVSSRKRINRNL